MMFSVSVACKASIIVSGDSDIIQGLSFVPPPDNRVFFANILGSGTKVVFQEGFAPAIFGPLIGFYTGILGVTVDTTTTTFTASDLAGANLLISEVPLSAYTPSEITLMKGFLSAGNTVFFIGEWGLAGFPEGMAGNGFINTALSSLGAGLSLVNADDDPIAALAVGSQIAKNPLTAGVNSFSYAATSEITGGTPLFFTTSGAPFVAVAAPVPEPSSALLLFAGVAGLATLRWRHLWRKVDGLQRS
jgi:hypothetical protein